MRANKSLIVDTAPAGLPEPFAGWFKARGWRPHAHQLALLDHAGSGRDTLLIAPTGGGKTLAGFLPSLVDLARQPPKRKPATAIHTLYVSPLKALAVDIARNLAMPVGRDGAADQARDPHRRHAALAPRAAAHPAARHFADHAGADRADAVA